MVDDATRLKIAQHLEEIARSRDVEVLYAVESGSRAWGFASTDSDYDIRFIYRHSPAWYLSVRERRDVIELPLDANNFDVSGWDLRKTLRLFLKSNPSLYEWLASPIVYCAIAGVDTTLRDMAVKHYDRRALAMHYRNLAVGQWKGYIRDKDEVTAKKYLYALRPLACLLWLCRKRTLPPVRFADVLTAAELPPATERSLADLLARKSSGTELGTGPRIGALDSWIASTLEAADDMIAPLHGDGPSATEIDALFRRLIGLDDLLGIQE